MQVFSNGFRLTAIAAACAALTSCATLNEEECLDADWQELGHEDGAAGRAPDHIDQHERACERHGLPVDQTSWQAGWEDGIRSYCTPQNGLVQGRQGSSYANSCPADLAAGFEGAYFVAKRLHDARAERDRIENQISALRAQARRQEDRRERRELRRQADDLRRDLRSADRRAREAEREYEAYLFTNELAMR